MRWCSSNNIQMSVKVGVRVRPFNQRQADLNCKLCVDMIGNMTRLEQPDNPGKPRDFTFDYSFWSHDGFSTLQNGYFEAQDTKYADQKIVYNAVGQEILANAWQGYHCCLFAYGQTGAGKSYSMVGYGSNKGIVPISCEEIFKRIELNDNKNKEYEVTVSMMEIYNERVQDLLIPIAKRPKEGYKIREHKMLGIYVEGMSKHLVETYSQIEQKMEEGGHNRSIAATEMNASSSRAHTIISIEFKQMEVIAGKKREKLSVIHLVDLAGSEKVGKTGAVGDRLKEAAGINKSLSALGLVIKILAENAVGQKNAIVPYRNSCLTRILQNALGGNSKTLMICAISPATDNYEETLSTLKYADQAKKIQNKAVINESETDKVIRVLREERDNLVQRLQKMEQLVKQFTMGKTPTPEQLQYLSDIKEQLRYNDEKMNDYTMTKQEKKMQEEQQGSYFEHFDINKPHLSNLNSDSSITRKANYSIDQEQTKIGKATSEQDIDIKISGVGIKALHAIIVRNEEEFVLQPIHTEEETIQGCYVNGKLVNKPERIFNFDRLKIGPCYFLIVIPDTDPREEVDQSNIDFEFAEVEFITANTKMSEKNNQQLKIQKEIEEQKKAELEEKLTAIRNLMIEKDTIAQEHKKQYENKIKNLMELAESSKKSEIAKSRRKYDFNNALSRTLSKCVEINLIAKELKRNVTFITKIVLDQQEQYDTNQQHNRTIQVKVINKELGYVYWWDEDKLEYKEQLIKEMSQKYFENGKSPNLVQDQDPFYDPPQHSRIGCAFLTTKGLTYMFDNPAKLLLTTEDQFGELTVNIMPTDEKGIVNQSEQAQVQQIDVEPEDLLNKPFYFKLYIQQAKVPANFKKIYVEYSLKVNETDEQVFRTDVIKEATTNPIFKYEQLHKYGNVTQKILEYLSTAKIVFKVYGQEFVEVEKHKEIVETEKKVVKQEIRKPLPPAQKQINTQKQPSAVKVAAKPKQSLPGTAKSNKTAGSNVNNKISKKDQEKAAKDNCIIY